MKLIHFLIGILLSSASFASDPGELPADRIRALVYSVNEASNRMMQTGSKVEEIDALFAMYSDDFVYIHEAYGGTYTRQELYDNSVRALNAGRYQLKQDRYRVLNVMSGRNAAAVERLEVKSGKVHLSVFEFKGNKVSKITEYWK